jgi:hypothetical protein
MNRPYFTISGRPTNRDAQYVMAEPKYDPNVPANTTPMGFSFPWAAKNAAGGMTISLGTGKIELSIAINRTIPG